MYSGDNHCMPPALRANYDHSWRNDAGVERPRARSLKAAPPCWNDSPATPDRARIRWGRYPLPQGSPTGRPPSGAPQTQEMAFRATAKTHTLDAHGNGPRCAQISGPTVGARERSAPSISWWQTRAGRQSLVKTVAAGGGGRRPVFTRDYHPRPRSVTEGDVRVRLAPGCGGATRLSATGWWVTKNEHTRVK